MKKAEHTGPERISFRSFGISVLQELNLEKGIGFTIKEMTLRPGKAIREYLFEDRSKYTKPLTLLLLVVAVATFISLQILPLNEELSDAVENDPNLNIFPEALQPTLRALPELLNKYFNIFFMSSIPALAFSTYFLFKEFKYNLAEHLVVNIYIFSIQTVIFMIFMPLFPFWEWTVYIHLALLIGYSIFAYTKVFEQNWGPGILKSALVYLMSQFFLSVFIAILLLVLLVVN